MKKIAIIGASAGVGLLAVQQALQSGHRVTTLSRSTGTLPTHPHLQSIKGSATVLADVQAAIDGAEVIIVTLGTGTKIDWATITKGTTLYTEATAVLLQALQGLPAPVPVIVLTGFGAGESLQYYGLGMRLLMSALLGRIYANKTRMEEMLTAGYGSWEIVRPGRLTDGPGTGHYRTYLALEQGMDIGSISRADVAQFLVAQAEEATALGKYVSLTA